MIGIGSFSLILSFDLEPGCLVCLWLCVLVRYNVRRRKSVSDSCDE